MSDLAWGKDVEFFQNVITARIGLIKECYESLLLDLGPVCNKFEYENYYIENPCQFGGGGAGGDIPAGNNADWLSCVERMGIWYSQNIHTYRSKTSKPWGPRKSYPCPLLDGRSVMDDCSSFVCACLWLHGVSTGGGGQGNAPSTAEMQPGSTFAKSIEAAGFKYFKIDWQQMPNNIQKGDIYLTDRVGHIEICWGPKMQMGWGSIHDGQNGHGGMPCNAGAYSHTSSGGGHYMHAWRKG